MSYYLYSRRKKAVYHLKRHVPGALLFLIGAILSYAVSDYGWFTKSFELLFSSLLTAGVLISVFLLIQHFAFPKFHFQETIRNEPVALAIFLGFLVLAIATVLR
jgi:hypothetical protein